ncbi:MAG: MFS transporter [Limnochordaceae bacterium]|uniref:MFS transporter n=1 Tax=Carboxydichorda subterranea TaxID=3109565 RepID=A0ABZ1BXS8_9FIRM|nr:MFS transporter [Limnochorda sp. L945t]MBE3599411.1 MFS transporter [Limnochordaceae bacterium]WRP16888.1 MFS transporter [Limnochorda sp. L945t]
MRPDTIRWFAVLSLVPFIMVLGNSMLIPVLPAIRSHLHLTMVQTGLVITAFSLPAAVTIPFAGALSDRVGRKAVMVPALVLYGIGGILAGLSAWLLPGRFWPIVGARVLQGIGAGGTYQLSMALVGDMFQSTERSQALGWLEASNGLGKVVSPLLGALAALASWFLPFFLYGVLALPVAFGVHRAVREKAPRREEGGVARYLRQIPEIARRRGAALSAAYGAGMLLLFALFGLLSLLSDELEARHRLSQLARGGIIAIPVGMMAIASFTSGRSLQTRPERLKPLSVIGLICAAAALGALAFVSRPLWLTIALSALLGLGTGLTLPAVNTLITGAVSRDHRGVVTAFYGTVRFGGVAVGPPLFGLATQATARLAVFAGTALALAALAWALSVVRVSSGPSPAQAGGPAQLAPAPGGVKGQPDET